MRKNYLFSLIVLVMVFAFAGMAFAEKMTETEVAKMQEEEGLRLTQAVSGINTANSSVLDEATVIYQTDFTTADDWTIIDGGAGTTTWALVDTAQQSNRPMFQQGTFMWIDSDEDGSGEHLIETLVSPTFDAGTYSHIYLLADVEFNNVNVERDSADIMFSTDGGTNWTIIETFHRDVAEYPYIWDISTLAAGQSSFQIAFHYDDDDGCMWYMGVDNVKILGSDTEEDLYFPEVEILAGPTSGFEGGEDLPVIAAATDNVGVTGVALMYGIIVENAIPDLQTVPMTATAIDTQYSAVIPGNLGVVGDQIGFVVAAQDAAGNIAYDPVGGSSVYVYEVMPMSQNYQITELPSYEWLEVSATGTDLNMGDSSIEEILFSEYDGIDSFTYFGVEYTSVFVNSNGWICFESGASAYTGKPTLPSTSNPNATIVMCGGDLDADEIGDVYVGMVDGKFVIQWGDDTGGCKFYYADNGPKGQIVLDGTTNMAYINYAIITGFTDDGEPYEYSHNMGIENVEGTVANVIYDGTAFTFPVNETSFRISQPVGELNGFVYEADGSTAIEGAEVNIYRADETEIYTTVTTLADGSYVLPTLFFGTYDVEVVAAGFESDMVEDIVIEIGGVVSQDFQLDAQTSTSVIQGYVYNADAATETVVEGVTVTLVQLDLTATTNAAGLFTFGEQSIGTYTFELSHDPIGSAGFHDVTYAGVEVVESNPDITFDINEILAPENLAIRAAFGIAYFSFDPPANHQEPEVLADMISELEILIAAHNNGEKVVENIAEVEKRLHIYQRIYNDLMTGSQLDELADFAGYKVKQDGTILDDVFEDENIEIDGLVDGQDYVFAVAADYGYGEDYLVFTDDVTVSSSTEPYRYEVTTYNWVEIRTNDLGTRVPWTSDDDYSGRIEFAGGETFDFYGIPFSDFNIGSNGFISFTEDAEFEDSCPYSNVDIPAETDPNGMFAAHWDWTEISDDASYSAYYYHDATNNLVIVTWYAPEWNATPLNMLEYQLVMNLETNEVIYNYKSAGVEWPEATIGVENPLGTEGVQYEMPTAATELALLFTQAPEISGTISGTVKETDTNGEAIAEVEVWAEGRREALGTTAADGTFDVTIPIGTYDIVFVHEDYWTVTETGISVTENTNTDMGEIFMTYPDPAVNPSSVTIDFDLETQTTSTGTFDLTNNGSGPMEFAANIQLVDNLHGGNNGNAELPVQRERVAEAKTFCSNEARGPVATASLDDVWDVILANIDIEGNTGNQDNFGLAMGANQFYVGGFYYGTLTTFNYDGTLVGQIDIDASMAGSNYDGVFGIASDPNGNLYAGNNDGNLFKFTPDMSSVVAAGSITGMAVSPAYDWDNNVLYVTEWGDPFYKIDASGTATAITGATATINGLAYVPMDEDGFTIYGHTDGANSTTIVRYNPSTDTWDETPVANIYTLGEDDSAGDLAGASRASGSFDFMTLKQSGTSDTADLWEGYTLQSWLSVAPAEGNILAGSSQQLTITVNPGNDPEFAPVNGDEFTAFVTISGPHMDDTVVLVTISFSGTDAGEVDNNLPLEYALHQNYPNPFNPTTEIKFDLVETQSVKLTVYNMLGQEVTRLVNTRMQAGFHTVTFDATKLSSGVYFYRLETPAYTSMKKMVMVK